MGPARSGVVVPGGGLCCPLCLGCSGLRDSPPDVPLAAGGPGVGCAALCTGGLPEVVLCGGMASSSPGAKCRPPCAPPHTALPGPGCPPPTWGPCAQQWPGQGGRRTGQRAKPRNPRGLAQQPAAANLGNAEPQQPRPPTPGKAPGRPALSTQGGRAPCPHPPAPVPGLSGRKGPGRPALSTPGPAPGSEWQEQAPCLDGLGRKVPHKVGGVWVVHHGQHSEGVPSEAKELGEVLWSREGLAGAELLADNVRGCGGVGGTQGCGGCSGGDVGLWGLRAHAGRWYGGRVGKPPHLPAGTSP